MAADLLQQALDIAVRELRSCLEHFHVVENHGGVLDVSHVLKQIDDLLDARRAQPLAAPATTTLTLQEACVMVRAQADEIERRRTEAFIAANATPPAAPAAVTEAMVTAGAVEYRRAMEFDRTADEFTARGMIRGVIQAALAAAASAGP